MGHNHHSDAIRATANQLTQLTGTPPRISEESGLVRLEFDVTPTASAHWARLVTVMHTGTSYGLTDTHDGQIAWLTMNPRDGHTP